jgi:hypothetical protein
MFFFCDIDVTLFLDKTPALPMMKHLGLLEKISIFGHLVIALCQDYYFGHASLKL